MGSPRLRFVSVPAAAYTSPNVIIRSNFSAADATSGLTGWDADYDSSTNGWTNVGNAALRQAGFTRGVTGTGGVPKSVIGYDGQGPFSVSGHRVFRGWVGDGTNVVGDHLKISWTGVSDVYYRFYVQYESGFGWTTKTHDKMCYGNQGGNYKILGFGFASHGNFFGISISTENSGVNIDGATMSWETFAAGGASTSDARWRLVECHHRMESSVGADDGVLEIWVDEVRLVNRTDITYTTALSQIEFNANMTNPNCGGGYMYRSYAYPCVADGYIGPYNATRGY